MFGLVNFRDNAMGARYILPDMFVLLMSLGSRRSLGTWVQTLRRAAAHEIKPAKIVELVRRTVMRMGNMDEDAANSVIPKWFRFCGYLSSAGMGYSANGVLQFLLFVAVHMRLSDGPNRSTRAVSTRIIRLSSSTASLQFLTAVIVCGAYVYTAITNTSQKVESSNTGVILGFWRLGKNGSMCCLSPAQVFGLTFAFLSHAFFALANATGDTGEQFTFRELMGFDIQHQMSKPLYYLPFVGLAVTFTGLTNNRGFPTSFIQMVDILSVLFVIVWMLASARAVNGIKVSAYRRKGVTPAENVRSFEEKWLFRSSRMLAVYTVFQYTYISLLYVYNLPDVAKDIRLSWPRTTLRNVTPYDFGLFETSALYSWKYLYHRYLTMALCVVLAYWLSERANAIGAPEFEETARRLELEPQTAVQGEQNGIAFALEAMSTMFNHVRDSIGEKVEESIFEISMEVLLVIATICVGFRIELLSVLYAIVIILACMELAVPSIRGTNPVSLRHGVVKAFGAVAKLVRDTVRWTFYGAFRGRRNRKNAITAESVADTPPRGTVKRNNSLTKEDYKVDLKNVPSSLHLEVNDYSFTLMLLACVSIIWKILTQVTIFQSGSLKKVVGVEYGSWLGLVSFADPRVDDFIETTSVCCRWPYVLDKSHKFCYDSAQIPSALNQYKTQACFGFKGNWYIVGVHYAVIIFAILHGFLQRRHNVRVQIKAKSLSAKATPRESYWARLRGEVKGCDIAMKLKLLIAEERSRSKEAPTPIQKRLFASTDPGFSPIVQSTPIIEEDDMFRNLPWAKAPVKKEKKFRKRSLRVLTLRMVYRFVSWDLSHAFTQVDSIFEQLASLKYLLAMVVLLINAFLKSDITSTVYILILGYFLAFNNGEGIARCQSQGYAILLIIGFILMVHVLTALRLPTSLLGSNYCEDCPEKHFWLDLWGCPYSSTSPPPSPPPPPSTWAEFVMTCSTRPFIVKQYEVVSDIIVMLLIGHYVRKGHKNMVRDDVRTAWMRGYMRFKGQVMGDQWVQSEAFTRMANKVNARLAERRKLDETSELTFDEKIKRWDAVASQLDVYRPNAMRDNRREETNRALVVSRRLSRKVSSQKEKAVIAENLTFAQIVDRAKEAATNASRSTRGSAEVMSSVFLKAFYKYLLIAILALTMIAAVTQADSDFISLSYACIAITFALNYDGLRMNCRVFRNRGYKWWNWELFRIMSTYVYLVLAAKLAYQIPYIKPRLLTGDVAYLGTCVEGTRKCEMINALFGLRKLGQACDAEMLASDCSKVLSWRSGSIGVDIILFLLCSIQSQLHSSEAYVRAVLKFEKEGMDRRARRSALHRKYIVTWRARITNALVSEYQIITAKVKESAIIAHEWSEYQKLKNLLDEEEVLLKHTPQDIQAIAESSTSVRLKWRMERAGGDVEAFYIKRERSPRVTILPHYVNPVRVDVDPESANSFEHILTELTPGASYTFVIVSSSKTLGLGPVSASSDVVTLPERDTAEDIADEPTKADRVLAFMSRASASTANFAAYLLDPALYPLSKDDTKDGVEWTSRGDWGDAGLISGLGKVVYSQSERIVYIALLWNFVDHMDLMSSTLLLFVLCFAALSNPQPTPAAWRFIFWYTVAMFYVRIIIRSRVFCMQLDTDADVGDRNKWHISMQPFCPRSVLYDTSADSHYSTTSAILLTVPRHRDLVRDEVISDIFLIVSLILHLTHMKALGQSTNEDTELVKPREDYEEYHAKNSSMKSRSFGRSTSKNRTESFARRRERESLEKRGSLKRQTSPHTPRSNLVVRIFRKMTKGVRDLVAQVSLRNSRRTPARDVGKPGIDLYALEIFLQFLIALWFVIDYSTLVFQSVTGLNSTESFGTGLTISIMCSVAWFVLMRIVYLTQSIRIKLALHVMQCVLYVVGIFFILPLVDTRPYVSPRHNTHLKGFTVMILLLFCLSALQIRGGYREGTQHRVLIMRLGNHPIFRIIFRLVNAIPFLFEIRTMLDWVVCNTSMDFIMWFRYETLFYLLHFTHLVHSWRKNERELYGGAIPFPAWMKALVGVGIILCILVLLTAPVFLFSTINPSLANNRVSTGTMEVHLDFETQRYVLYTGLSTGFAMTSDDDYTMQKQLIGREYYQSADSDCIRFPKFSESAWILPSLPKAELATALQVAAARSSCGATLTISTSFARNGPPNAQTLTTDFVATLSDSKCSEFAAVISADTGSIEFNGLIPRGLHLPPGPNVEIIDRETEKYIGLNMTLGSTARSMLWSAAPMAAAFPVAAPDFCGTNPKLPLNENGILLAVVSDRYLVGLVSSLGLSSYSVRALYIFIFFTVGLILRSFFTFRLTSVFISEMSSVEEVMNVCKGLRLIRSLDYPGRRRDELKMYHALMRMTRQSSIKHKPSIDD